MSDPTTQNTLWTPHSEPCVAATACMLHQWRNFAVMAPNSQCKTSHKYVIFVSPKYLHYLQKVSANALARPKCQVARSWYGYHRFGVLESRHSVRCGVPRTERSPAVARFEGFELDLRSGELRRNGGQPIRLADQPFRILVALLEHPHEVVFREEIRRKLWPNDTIVEFEHSISAAMNRLRQVLGDSGDGPRYIETLARRGYRWMVPVEWIEPNPAVAPPPPLTATTTEPRTGQSLIGKKLSHYRILELLGGGGMGVVYRAEDLRLGRSVAIKFLGEELTDDPRALERFEREARAISALDHPNICTIYEVEEHEGQPFIVMQLLQGQTLRQRIESSAPEQPAFSRRELLDVASQIVAALDAAHQKGIIHRDIKPANIFLTQRGEVKLLDFGLAKLVDSSADGGGLLLLNRGVAGCEDQAFATDASHLGLTLTGATLGTASYMSPEQVRKEPVDARSDLFSFGAVFYEMATGHQAFCGDCREAIHDAILNHTPPSPLVWNPNLPAELESVMARALEKDRQKRYQSAAEISSDLEEHKRKESGVEDQTTLQPPTADSDSRSREGHGAKPSRAARYLSLTVWLFVVSAVVVAAGIWFWRPEVRPHSLPEVKQRRLTTSLSDDPVRSGAISLDGKYLAFADLQGLHVRMIETGETRDLSQPKELEGSPVYWRVIGWFPGGTSFLANSTLPPEYGPQHPSVWEVSVLAGQARRIREDAEAWSISPDGSTIAFSVSTGRLDSRSLWLMGASGEQARKLFDAGEGNSLVHAQWSPDGRRLAYLRSFAFSSNADDVLESRDLLGGPATVIVSAPWIWGFVWLADGRIIYSMAEPLATAELPAKDCNFWSLKVNARTGTPIGAPRQLTNWGEFCMESMSATADSKKLAFVESATQGTVYVADVHANGARVDNVRLLTPNLGFTQPTGWSADGNSVILRSNREGRWRIDKQPLDGTPPESLVRDAENATQARVIGRWVVYLVRPKGTNAFITPTTVMRVPIAGGSAQEVLEAPINGLRCGRVSCIAILGSPDQKQTVFRAFDPIQGLGRELARADRGRPNYAFSLSPDGTQIAVLPSFQQSIDIYPVSGAAPWKVTVKDWPKVDNVNWAADGKGFYVFSPSPRGSVLLHVDLQGNAHVLWEQPGGLQTAGIPSLDGRHLAIRGWTVNSNVWMMENF
jgi:eukaryotic-like serine/threonine-protein kinase